MTMTIAASSRIANSIVLGNIDAFGNAFKRAQQNTRAFKNKCKCGKSLPRHSKGDSKDYQQKKRRIYKINKLNIELHSNKK
jgi:hypothetical protein